MLNTQDAQQTLHFVNEYIPQSHAKLLIVGTEAARLRDSFIQSGYVTEIVEANFLDFTSEEKFDGILLYRSVFSAGPLETLFNKVKILLDEKGRLLVEDLSPEEIDEKTADWFFELKDLLTLLGGQSLEAITPGDGPMERWKKMHTIEKSHHSGKELTRSMERNFGNIHAYFGPFLFRYFNDISESLSSNPLAQAKILEWETKLIDKGQIKPIGLRIVAKKYFSYLK